MVTHNEYIVALSEKLCPLVWSAPLGDLSSPEQVVVSVYEVEREVNNGGLHQFFWNSFGCYARHSIEALERIGALEMASIARAATRLAFPSGNVPETKSEREDVLEAAGERLEDALEELDSAFLAYPNDLTELLFQYVQDNLASIRWAAPA